MNRGKSRKSNQAERIPIPLDLLSRTRHVGKFQHTSRITIPQYRAAIEAFSRGTQTVMTRKESERHYESRQRR